MVNDIPEISVANTFQKSVVFIRTNKYIHVWNNLRVGNSIIIFLGNDKSKDKGPLGHETITVLKCNKATLLTKDCLPCHYVFHKIQTNIYSDCICLFSLYTV